MKKLPISIQTFEEIRKEDLIYVDKTSFIWKMVNEGKYYFFSRPRRFGKSLLLSTLKAYFLGKKEVFEGLAIYEKEKEWIFYPVIHIDYSLVDYTSGIAIFNASLLDHLQTIAKQYDLEIKNTILANVLRELVVALYEKFNQQVVILSLIHISEPTRPY